MSPQQFGALGRANAEVGTIRAIGLVSVCCVHVVAKFLIKNFCLLGGRISKAL